MSIVLTGTETGAPIPLPEAMSDMILATCQIGDVILEADVRGTLHVFNCMFPDKGDIRKGVMNGQPIRAIACSEHHAILANAHEIVVCDATHVKSLAIDLQKRIDLALFADIPRSGHPVAAAVHPSESLFCILWTGGRLFVFNRSGSLFYHEETGCKEPRLLSFIGDEKIYIYDRSNKRHVVHY